MPGEFPVGASVLGPDGRLYMRMAPEVTRNGKEVWTIFLPPHNDVSKARPVDNDWLIRNGFVDRPYPLPGARA